MGWQKNHILLLIGLYKKEPVLYDTTHKDYRNRYKREAAWNRIIETVAEARPNTGVRDIRDKIENLRTVYALQKRKVDTSILERRNIYVPTIWYYPHLSFLDEFLRSRKNNNELDEDAHHFGDVLDCEFLQNEKYESIIEELLKEEKKEKRPPAKKPRKRKTQDETFDDAASRNIEKIEDRYSVFGSYIADRLRSIGGETSQKLENDIINLLMEVEEKSKAVKTLLLN